MSFLFFIFAFQLFLALHMHVKTVIDKEINLILITW
jgi:hypothetical protein